MVRCFHESQRYVFLAFLHYPGINSLSLFLSIYTTLQLFLKNPDPSLMSLFNVLLITIWSTTINSAWWILIVGKMNPFSKLSTSDSLTWRGHHKGLLKFTVKRSFFKNNYLCTDQKRHLVHWWVHTNCQHHN